MINIVNHENTDIAFSPSIIGASVFGYEVWADDKSKIECELATKYVGKQFLDNTSNDNRSLPGYIVNDMVFSWSNSCENGCDLKLSLFVNNMLDNMYSANGWTYSFLYGGPDSMRTENYVYPQAGRHGFMSLIISF